VIRIELPDETKANVIELRLVREAPYARRMGGPLCAHNKVTVDTTLAELVCDDCKVRLNPIEYIAGLIDHWHRVEQRAAAAREAVKLLDAKQKCRCDHCGKMTRVRPASPAQVRKFEKGAK